MNNQSKTVKKRVSMDAALQAHLGAKLRQLFAETASQPIPDRFAALLDRLEARAGAAEAGAHEPQSILSIEVNA